MTINMFVLTVAQSVLRDLLKLVYLPCLYPMLLLLHHHFHLLQRLAHRLWVLETFPSEMPLPRCLACRVLTKMEGQPRPEQPKDWHVARPTAGQQSAGGLAD